MDKETVIALVQETIFDFPNDNPYDFTLRTVEQMQHFAALVATAERDLICTMLDDLHRQEERHNYYGFIRNLIREMK